MDLCALLGILFTALAVILLMAVLDLKRRGYSKNIPLKELVKLYFLAHLSGIKIYRMHKEFERDVRHFEEAQAKFLMDRIRRCENTAIGRDHHFSSIRNVADFRRTVPIFDFFRVEEYVNRLADGEKSALLGEEDDVFIIASTSGTIGRNKRIPVSNQGAKDMQDQLLAGAFQWCLRSRFQWNLKRMLNINNARTVEYTKGGYVVSNVSHIVRARTNTVTAQLNTTPLVGQRVKSEFEAHYIHALFGLRDKHIIAFRTAFVYNFITVMHRIQLNLKDLLNDMRRGRIKEDLNIPPDVRDELNRHLTPMTERAAEVEREFAKGMTNIVPRLWPEMERASGIWSGSTNEVYYKEARQMLGPNIPLVSFSYNASEGFMGINISSWSEPPRYTLIPSTLFFEFLPIINDQIPDLEDIDPKELLLGQELELNKEYEMFITTPSGFYRYRLGDIIRVVGFYQQAPQVEFLYRSGQSMDAGGDKMSEAVFYRALRDAARQWPAKLKDYTAASRQYSPQGEDRLCLGYILFIELEGGPLTEQQTDLVDDILREQSDEYACHRKLKRLSKIVTYQVTPGTFARFRTHVLETTEASANQFKMPRVLKTSDRVAWFLENVRK